MSAASQRLSEAVSGLGTTEHSSEATNPAERERGAVLRPVTKGRTDDDLAVTLSVAELRNLVRDAALEAVAEAANDSRPALLDRNGLARALGCSPSTVGRLRSEGMPVVMLVDAPRFEIEAVLAWLRERGPR